MQLVTVYSVTSYSNNGGAYHCLGCIYTVAKLRTMPGDVVLAGLSQIIMVAMLNEGAAVDRYNGVVGFQCCKAGVRCYPSLLWLYSHVLF